MRRPHRGDGFQPLIDANPVVHMHDQITHRQALGFGQEVFGAPFATGAADQTVAQHVLLGNHRHTIAGKAVFQRPDHQMHAISNITHIVDLA